MERAFLVVSVLIIKYKFADAVSSICFGFHTISKRKAVTIRMIFQSFIFFCDKMATSPYFIKVELIRHESTYVVRNLQKLTTFEVFTQSLNKIFEKFLVQ